MSRDTGTGSAFKSVVESALTNLSRRFNFEVERSVIVGVKPNGKPNRVDFVIRRTDNESRRGIVSCRSQSVGGTAEEKVAFEVIRLLRTMQSDSRYKHSWLVLGGSGWSDDLVDFYMNDLKIYIPKMTESVTILRTDELLSAEILI